jgi:hypothetical protein
MHEELALTDDYSQGHHSLYIVEAQQSTQRDLEC